MATERNFNNFYLGDNVYELANGVIPEIAERLDIKLSQEPNSAELQEVMNKLGINRVLRDNKEVVAIDRNTMADLLQISGVQEALGRSLWTPEVIAEPTNLDFILMTGGVANWQDRTADEISAGGLYVGVPIKLLAGTRPMASPTEVNHPKVVELNKVLDRAPSEAEYIAAIIAPRLIKLGHEVAVHTFDTQNGDEILEAFFEKNKAITMSNIAMARVANAGVAMAIQMRDAARKINPDFDKHSDDPQTYVITDGFPISRSEEGDNNPAKYQKAATGLRQLVLTAKKLHEASGGE